MYPDGLWVLTAIRPNREGIRTKTFTAGAQTEDAREWIKAHNGQWNLYWHVNQPTERLTKKATKADIESAHFLHVDIDCRAGEDREEELERIRALTEENWPKDLPRPTVIVYSGGGRQCFWRLDAPVPIKGDAALAEDFERYNRAVELPLGGDNCSNVDRIMRLPGTVNLPDAKKAAMGRVPVEATVVSINDDVVSLEAFAPAPPRTPFPGSTSASPAAVALIDTATLEVLPDRLAALAVQGHDPDNPAKYPSRSEAVFGFACNCLRADVPEPVILGCLLDRDLKISGHVLDQPKPEQYARRQVERAREAVSQEPQLAGDGTVPLSEDHLADALLNRHADDLRYCAQFGSWFRWTGQLWAKEETLYVFDLSRAVCREASRWAAGQDKYRKLARVLAGASTVSACERLAKADRRVALTADTFDADPMLLNTPAGVVDLRTGQLSGHDRTSYCTKVTRVGPEDGVPEHWLTFLDTVTNGDADFMAYLQRVAGYCLTGQTVEHALFFAHGPGGNGKSVLQETMLDLLGGYAKTTSFNTLVVQRGGPQHPTDLAALMGARFVVAPETEANERWAEAKIKQMTGGDTISARFMRQDFFEYKPQFKLFVVGNHRPSFANVDEAVRRRIHLMPFDVKIAKPDKHFREQRLMPEAGQILQWAIEGCLMWQAEGLRPPERVLATTTSYLDHEDVFGQWLAECTVRERGASATFAHLWASWSLWTAGANERLGTKRGLGNGLSDRGFDAGRGTGNKPIRLGLRLSDEVMDGLVAQEQAAVAKRRIARRVAEDVATEMESERVGRAF